MQSSWLAKRNWQGALLADHGMDASPEVRICCRVSEARDPRLNWSKSHVVVGHSPRLDTSPTADNLLFKLGSRRARTHLHWFRGAVGPSLHMPASPALTPGWEKCWVALIPCTHLRLSTCPPALVPQHLSPSTCSPALVPQHLSPSTCPQHLSPGTYPQGSYPATYLLAQGDSCTVVSLCKEICSSIQRISC